MGFFDDLFGPRKMLADYVEMARNGTLPDRCIYEFQGARNFQGPANGGIFHEYPVGMGGQMCLTCTARKRVQGERKRQQEREADEQDQQIQDRIDSAVAAALAARGLDKGDSPHPPQ